MQSDRRFLHWFWILLIGSLAYLTNLGATHLWDVDEAIFSRCSVEMLERGDWVTPYYNGEVFGHKPPVMYWFQMAAFRAMGETEFAARFFSAVFGIGTLLLTYELGAILFNARAGLWSALALTGCLNFAVIARAATPDAYLTFFCTLAMLALVRGTSKQGAPNWEPELHAKWKTYAVSYVAMGIAVLVKGPVGVILPMAVWGMFLLIEQRRRESNPSSQSDAWYRTVGRWFAPVFFLKTIWRMRPVTAVAIVLAVAAPWYVWVGYRTDGLFLREFFLKHNIGRATTAMDSHSGPFYYYLLAICIGTFPWCMLLAPAIGNLIRAVRKAEPTRAAFTLLACWACVWLGCFSLVSTKLPSYIIPAYPAIALCFGALVNRWLSAVDLAACQRWLRNAWVTVAVVGACMLIAIPVMLRTYMPGEWSPALIALIPLAGAIVGLAFWFRSRADWSLVTLTTMGILFAIGLLGFAALPIDGYQNSPRVAALARFHAEGNPFLASHNYLPPSMVYYHRRAIEKLGTAEEISEYFVAHPHDAFLVTTSSGYERIAEKLPAGIDVVARDRRFLRKGDIVLLGRTASEHVSQRKRPAGSRQ
jgi:4-amino-4-deoxy-L-arabinose transferase-like glycosyltransferase